jgi:hypothetical protein
MIRLLKHLFFVTIILAGCSGSDPENLPEDEVSAVKKNPGKGFCITTSRSSWNNKIIALNASWHYSWNNELKQEEPEGVEFVPMIWGAGSDTLKVQQKIDYIKNLKDQNKAHFMLGFNEPDKADQANMSVETALAYWPKLQSVGLPLGSPACANPTGDWMKSFMQEAKNRNFRIDFLCVHWYGGISVPGFLNRLKEIHDLYHLPIWITEFAPADWSATSPANSKFTKAEILTFMKEALPSLDTLSYVQRFAWFSADETSGPLGNAALFDSSDNLTALGKFYAAFEGKTK